MGGGTGEILGELAESQIPPSPPLQRGELATLKINDLGMGERDLDKRFGMG